MPARYRNRSGFMTPDENQRLSDYEVQEGLWLEDRPTSKQDFQAWIKMHARHNCALVRDGQVLVSVPGHNPLERLR